MVKTALVTGASSGIGFELAKLLAKDNFDLVIVAKDKNRILKVKNELSETFGIKVTAIKIDLASASAAKKIYDELSKNKVKIDVLINCAGLGDFSSFIDSNLDKNSEMIDVNCRALTELTWFFARDMVKRKKGRIMNVASVAGFFPGPLMAVYFATKAYVLHFTEALAEELKNTNVTVTALCPGPTKTPFIGKANQKESGIIKEDLPSAEDVAVYGYNAMLNGKRVAVYGWKNKLNVFLARFLPRNIVAKFVMKAQK